MTRNDVQKLKTLDGILAGFNAHDLDAILAFFTDDCIFDSPRGSNAGGTRYEGKAAVREGFARRFRGIPDVHYGDARHWVAGDRGVSEWLLTGTSVDGETIAVRGCDLWEFRGDEIARKDSYWKIVDKP
jgi:ketosteroid isomerase-like protein